VFSFLEAADPTLNWKFKFKAPHALWLTSESRKKYLKTVGRSRMAGTKVTVGKRVRVEGLTGRVDLNGKLGTVSQVKEEGKFAVKLEEGTEVILKSANLVIEETAAKKEQPEPRTKRARFADEPSEIKTVVSKGKKKAPEMQDDDEEIEISDEDEEENDDPPYSTWANKVVTIRLIRNKTDEGICFNLEKGYTHQVLSLCQALRKHENSDTHVL
jgi:hypothetical protein